MAEPEVVNGVRSNVVKRIAHRKTNDKDKNQHNGYGRNHLVEDNERYGH